MNKNRLIYGLCSQRYAEPPLGGSTVGNRTTLGSFQGSICINLYPYSFGGQKYNTNDIIAVNIMKRLLFSPPSANGFIYDSNKKWLYGDNSLLILWGTLVTKRMQESESGSVVLVVLDVISTEKINPVLLLNIFNGRLYTAQKPTKCRLIPI